jgi:hypothetical protein
MKGPEVAAAADNHVAPVLEVATAGAVGMPPDTPAGETAGRNGTAESKPDRVPITGSGGGSANLDRMNVTEEDKAAVRKEAAANGEDGEKAVRHLTAVAAEAKASPLHIDDVRALGPKNLAGFARGGSSSPDAYSVSAGNLAAEMIQRAEAARAAHETAPSLENRAARDQAAKDKQLAPGSALFGQIGAQFDPSGDSRTKASIAAYMENRLPWDQFAGVPGRYSLPDSGYPEAGGIGPLRNVPTGSQ